MKCRHLWSQSSVKSDDTTASATPREERTPSKTQRALAAPEGTGVVSAVNTAHRPCPTPGPSSDRAQGQPRLNLSVAPTECAPWVLNCKRAYFGLGDTSFAKLR